MICTSDEYIENCSDCGEPAVLREAWAIHPKGQRKVSYWTHERDLRSPGFQAAIQRMDRFHEKLADLQEECRLLPVSERELEYGLIKEIEFDNRPPSACKPRTEVGVGVIVRVAGLEEKIELGNKRLDGLSAREIVSEAREEANTTARKLKIRFDKGLF